MSAATTIHRARASGWPRAHTAWQLVSAELLKVRKRRGLMALAVMLTAGAIVAAGAVLTLLHAQDPAKYGPAGGRSNLANAAYMLSMLGTVTAVLVGATMGAGDLQAGVFRDLVATGRSRLALFAARIPGGLALLWPLVAVSWVIAAAGSALLAGSAPRPGLGLMVYGGAWVLLAATVIYLMALGLASLTGSRSATVAIVLAWQFALSPLALNAAKLGVVREGVLLAALDRLIPAGLLPGAPPNPVSPTMSLTVTAVVIAAWAVIPLAAAAWRTTTRDA
jgi:ABC-type transport system involved in multi-copper enzyme maturation permease subunit